MSWVSADAKNPLIQFKFKRFPGTDLYTIRTNDCYGGRYLSVAKACSAEILLKDNLYGDMELWRLVPQPEQGDNAFWI